MVRRQITTANQSMAWPCPETTPEFPQSGNITCNMSTPAPLPQFDVSRRSVLIAGAPGGIGAAICRMFAGQGAWLALFDRDGERLQAFSDTLDVPHFSVAGDITDAEAVESVFTRTRELYGSLDIVVNAAGLLPIEATDAMEPEDFRACIDTNVTGAWLVSRAAARHMDIRGGAILHIASVSSRVANTHYAAYASSKAALSQLVRVLGREWASRDIRVNAIGPALIDTPLTRDYLADDDFLAQAVSAIPMGRLATPEDLLGAVLLLCSAAGEFITGQTIYIDGGRTLTG
jgi:NAD(P)-dependent dehydrogenase (short-subunit alcohol dehydrogenase family)